MPAVAALRSIMRLLGVAWPYLPSSLEGFYAPEVDEDPDYAVHETEALINFVVLKPEYVKETASLNLTLPCTLGEAIEVLQAARTTEDFIRFPHLHAVNPQSVPGHAVFVAGPRWYPATLIICVNTIAIDGRLFAAKNGEYADYDSLCWHADLPSGAGYQVYVGGDDQPLFSGVRIHLSDGMQAVFVADDELPSPGLPLPLLLTLSEPWQAPSELPEPNIRDAYLLVSKDSHMLHIEDFGQPFRFRENIAARAGLRSQAFHILPAFGMSPSMGSPVAPFLLRAPVPMVSIGVGEGIRFVCRDDQTIDLGSLEEALAEAAPIGWGPQIRYEDWSELSPPCHPGAVFTVEYVPNMPPDPGAEEVAQAGASGTEDAGKNEQQGGQQAGAARNREARFSRDTGDPQSPADDDLSNGDEGAGGPALSPDTALDGGFLPLQFLLYSPEYKPEGIAPGLITSLLFSATIPRCGPLKIIGAAPGLSRRVFAACVPRFFTKKDALFMAQVDPLTDCEVFHRDVPWPIPDGYWIYPEEGDLIAFHPAGVLQAHGGGFHQLLQGEMRAGPLPVGLWDSEITWVLSDGPHVAVPVPEDQFALNSAQAAAALGLRPGHFLLVPTTPEIVDHARHGTPSRRALIAVQAEGEQDVSVRHSVPYVFDMRPIHLYLSSASAPDGVVDIVAICDRLKWRCPRGFHVRIYGGVSDAEAGSHVRRVVAGDIITAEFHPDFVREVVLTRQERRPVHYPDRRGAAPPMEAQVVDDPGRHVADEGDASLPAVRPGWLLGFVLLGRPGAALLQFRTITALPVGRPMLLALSPRHAAAVFQMQPRSAVTCPAGGGEDLQAFLTMPCQLAALDRVMRLAPAADVSKLFSVGVDATGLTDTRLHCFTDGSFTASRGDRRAKLGWACVLVDPVHARIGLLSGRRPDWLPEDSDPPSAFVAECLALEVALRLCGTALWHVPVVIRSDCFSALEIAAGRALSTGEGVAGVLRHAGSFGRAAARYPPVLEHVRGHTGCLFNEVADVVAKLAANGQDLGAFVSPGRDGGSTGACSSDAGLTPLQCIEPFLPFVNSEPHAERKTGRLLLHLATYNVLSLCGKAFQDDRTAGLAFVPARPAILAAAFHACGVTVAGVQEARTEEGRLTTEGFLRICSGATKGQFGVELWFKVGCPVVISDEDSSALVTFEPASFTVLHADPRRLLVLFSAADVRFLFVALHAPHRGAEGHILDSWWSETLQLLEKHAARGSVFLLGDFNAAVGSLTSCSVGDHDADAQDPAGDFLHDTLQRLSLWLPATFSSVHDGPSGTYVQKRNQAESRIDFVAIPGFFSQSQVWSWIEPSIHAGQPIIDHLAALVSVCARIVTSRGKPTTKRPRVNASLLLTPEGQACVAKVVTSAPQVPWEVGPDAHAALVVAHLQEGLKEVVAVQGKQPKHPYISQETWSLQRQVAGIRRRLSRLKGAVRSQELASAFASLRLGHGGPLRTCWGSAWMQSARGTSIQLGQALQSASKQLRAGCKADRAHFLSNLADSVSAGGQSAHEDLRRLLCMRKRKPFAPELLPQLLDEKGELCGDHDATLARWRRHFSRLEGGVVLEPQSVAALRPPPPFCPEAVPAEDFPTPADLLGAILHTKSGKACGPDGIPAEFGKADPVAFQQLLWPLLLKVGLLCKEPLGFKSGILTWLYKGKGFCALLGQADPGTVLHTERLRYARQLVCNGPEVLWALVRCDNAYLCGVREAFRWLFAWVRATTALPALEVVRTSCYAALQALLRSLEQIGGAREAAVRAEGERPDRYTEACLICRIAFPTRAAWSVHAAKKHGYRAPTTLLSKEVEKPLCLGCGRLYANAARLRRHLLHSAKCREGWGSFCPDVSECGALHPQMPPLRVAGTVHAGVWQTLLDFAEPLDVLKQSLQDWATHPDAVPAAAELAEDARLLLDPELWCEDFRKGKGRAQGFQACVDLRQPVACRFDFVLTGVKAEFRVDDPPLPEFVYPFRHSVPLTAARRHLAWLEHACDTFGAFLSATQSSP
ncbi:unnamed protein product, partial [Symbiodinium necroappetens]